MSRHRRRHSSRRRARDVAYEARPRSLDPAECLDDRPPADAAQYASLEPPGVMLREAREARGLTLEDIARTTKIGKAALTALEASDVLRLPAAIYTRGFVKAFASEVGLNPDETADEYLRRIEPLTTHHLLADDGMLPPLAESARHVDINDDTRQLLAVNQVRRFGRVTTVGAIVGLIVYLVSFNREVERRAPDTTSSLQSVDAARAIASSPDAPPVGASTITMTAASDAVRVSGPLQIELTPQGPCWLVATVDGERVVARLLQPGERQTLAISEEVVLRVGDPGVLTISINGHSGRTLGRPGQPVNVKITKENFKEFLSS